MTTNTNTELEATKPHRRLRSRISAAVVLLFIAALASPHLVGADARQGSTLHARPEAATALVEDDDDDEDEDDVDGDEQAPVTQPASANESGDAAVPGSPNFTG